MLLGVARLHYEGGQDGEYAILVRSRLKGPGLGWFLMTRGNLILGRPSRSAN